MSLSWVIDDSDGEVPVPLGTEGSAVSQALAFAQQFRTASQYGAWSEAERSAWNLASALCAEPVGVADFKAVELLWLAVSSARSGLLTCCSALVATMRYRGGISHGEGGSSEDLVALARAGAAACAALMPEAWPVDVVEEHLTTPGLLEVVLRVACCDANYRGGSQEDFEDEEEEFFEQDAQGDDRMEIEGEELIHHASQSRQRRGPLPIGAAAHSSRRPCFATLRARRAAAELVAAMAEAVPTSERRAKLESELLCQAKHAFAMEALVWQLLQGPIDLRLQELLLELLWRARTAR